MKYISNRHLLTLILPLTTLLFTGCEKWLDEKPLASLATPTTVKDIQALLDNNAPMNTFGNTLGEVLSDNYYCPDAKLYALSQPEERALYLFEYDSVRFDSYPNAWSFTYDVVFIANTCLEQLDKMNPEEKSTTAWRQAYGSAFFFRARSFQSVLNTWAVPFEAATAAQTPGIPLRLNSNFNEVSERASLQQSYDQVKADLQAAIEYLPALSEHPFRPSQATAWGYLARYYMSVRDYTQALDAATNSFRLYNVITDYNTLSLTPNFPFKRFNEEVLHQLRAGMPGILITGAYSTDTVLLKSYASNDLRKNAYFRTNTDGTTSFKGSYEGNGNLFIGLATDEVLLMRSECLVRTGNVSDGIDLLNQLLVKRFVKGSFTPYQITDATQALSTVLTERRKSLAFRDLRWFDLRRLNAEGANIVVKRLVGGKEYVLMPGSKKYAAPIPAAVIERSKVEQNRYD